MFLSSFMKHKRSTLVGIVGVVVLVLGVGALLNQTPAPPVSASGQMALGNSGFFTGNNAPAQGVMPSFEVVRINDDGSAVFSGKAAAGATVQISLDGAVFSIVRADAEGDWLYTYDLGNRLPTGQHVMQLLASLEGYADSQHDEILLIDLPLVNAAGDGEKANQAAMVFAYNSQQGMRVLQRPGQSADLENLAVMQNRLTQATAKAKSVVLADTLTQQPTATGTPDPADDPVAAAISASLDSGSFDSGSFDSDGAFALDPSTPEATSSAVVPALTNITPISIQSMGLSVNSQNITIVGTAEPEADLSAVVNDLIPASVRIGGDGKFSITVVSDNIRQKVQTIVLKQSKAGQILSTTTALLNPQGDQQPPDTQTSGPDTDNVRTITVRKGESLWSLAVRVYGDGTRYEKIFAANRDVLKRARDLKPGMQLRIP